MDSRDTIFALSSGRPPAAISIIRLSGPKAREAAAEIAGTLPPARLSVLRELRHPASGELLDHALVVRFDGPASSTGEDVVELHCHGGRAVVDALLACLAERAGLRQALPGEFTRRAFESGRIDLTEAEGLADLIEAETESQRKAAMRLAEGALSRQVERWRERLLSLSAKAEHAIDYDEDDARFDSLLARDCNDLAMELEEWLRRPRAEPLKDGVLVVVAGPVNAGKSSLINAIVGEDKVIVADVPGTTRDSIEVPLVVSGVPIRLTDTAGIRRTGDRVEALGVERAGRLVRAADVLLWLGDPHDAPEHARRINVHAKSDLPQKGSPPDGSIAVSSLTSAGISELLENVARLARLVLPADDQITLNRRQAALLSDAQEALSIATSADDIAIFAEALRQVRFSFDRLTGRAAVEDVLDEMFRRFCLGK
jgi:tRNA modification GTPase